MTKTAEKIIYLAEREYDDVKMEDFVEILQKESSYEDLQEAAIHLTQDIEHFDKELGGPIGYYEVGNEHLVQEILDEMYRRYVDAEEDDGEMPDTLVLKHLYMTFLKHIKPSIEEIKREMDENYTEIEEAEFDANVEKILNILLYY